MKPKAIPNISEEAEKQKDPSMVRRKGFKSKVINLEQTTYYIQKRSQTTGEWRSVGNPITGWTTAYQTLWKLQGRAKKKKVSAVYRVTSKREAEKYREAWRDAQHFARFGEPRRQFA